MSGFLVKSPGMLTLLQDAGRFGAYAYGLTNGGPLDRLAFHWANRLCTNPLPATVLEISVGGLTLLAQLTTKIALTGATMPVTINGKTCEMWRSLDVNPGDVIAFGYATAGIRSYLAVAGGFNVSNTFGSTATVCREKIGGLRGGKLTAGDFLPCADQRFLPSQSNHNYSTLHWCLEEKHRPVYQRSVTLRTIPSYQQHHFSPVQQRLFFSSEYTIGNQCDRMGYRLCGPQISADISGILSEGICHGAVQIPADGQPIVLLNDRQTIGGYPKIGAVIASDTAKLAQLNAGGAVHFEPISMEAAHNINHLEASLFAQTPLTRMR